MAEARCLICGEDFATVAEMEQLEHLNKCLDLKLNPLMLELEQLSGTVEPASQSSSRPIGAEPDPAQVDTSDMPKYEEMTKAQIQLELEKFGMKKSIDPSQAKVMLKEIWLYQKHGIWPKFLQEFV